MAQPTAKEEACPPGQTSFDFHTSQIVPIALQDWLESRPATDIPVRFMATSDLDSTRPLNEIAYSPMND